MPRQAHGVSHRAAQAARMIPTDLVIALAPFGLLFALWVLGD